MVKKCFMVMVVCSLLGISLGIHADESLQPAQEAAEKWLKIVDNEQYQESWDEAASYFKNAVMPDAWTQQMNAFRRPLGKALSRKILTSDYMKELPGAPDGEYVVIQYQTSFENKQSAVETITAILDTDGNWRIAGYYIK